MSLIIDASLTLAWYFADEATPATDSILERVALNGAVVPPLWRFEVVNAMQTGIRRKRIDSAYRDRSIANLASLPITFDPHSDAVVWSTALKLADQHGLTIYDACYLELALRRNMPLATLDKALRAAGANLGLSILGL